MDVPLQVWHVDHGQELGGGLLWFSLDIKVSGDAKALDVAFECFAESILFAVGLLARHFGGNFGEAKLFEEILGELRQCLWMRWRGVSASACLERAAISRRAERSQPGRGRGRGCGKERASEGDVRVLQRRYFSPTSRCNFL